jgi:7,8-dihydro-6-hydroxymethylpterin-pyrophosphokinase
MEAEEGRVRAIVSLGSNIEPRVEYLSRAVDALSSMPSTKLVAASGVVETEESKGQSLLIQYC